MSNYRSCITEYDRAKNLAFERAEGFAEGFCIGLEKSLNEQSCWRETEDKAAFLREYLAVLSIPTEESAKKARMTVDRFREYIITTLCPEPDAERTEESSHRKSEKS